MSLINPELLYKRGLARKVYELLSQLSPLPLKGIVAGQAVASAIDVVLGTGSPVFNDIDIFADGADWDFLATQYPEIACKPARQGNSKGPWFTAPVSFTGMIDSLTPVAADAEFANYLSTNEYQNFYRVMATRCIGLLNLVRIDYASGIAPRASLEKIRERKAQALLQGFDINSTQAAIHLETGKLYFTKAFEHYFSNRQLRVVGVFTPVQTILRYFKKRQELGCYGNDEAVVKLLGLRMQQTQPFEALNLRRAKAFVENRALLTETDHRELTAELGQQLGGQFLGPVGMGPNSTPFVLGAKYKEMLDRYGAPIKDVIKPLAHPSRPLWLMERASVVRRVTGTRKLPMCSGSMPLRFEEQELRPSKQTIGRMQIFKEFLAPFPKELKTWYQDQFIALGPAFLEGIENPRRELLSRLIQAHDELRAPLKRLPFSEQIAFVQLARKALIDAQMPLIWSAFAHKTSRWTKQALLQPELLRRVVEALRPTMELVAEPLTLPKTIGAVEVVELLSGHTLHEEGSFMRHCVGGYTDHVAQGHSRILSLRAGPNREDRATVEWRFGPDDGPTRTPYAMFKRSRVFPLKAFLVQARTFANQRPNKKLLAAELELRNAFNAWAIKAPAVLKKQLHPAEFEKLQLLPGFELDRADTSLKP